MDHKVLIVEDESATIAFLDKILSRHGFKVTSASNGKEALKLIEADLPDIIISDVMMPEMGGFEFYRRLLQSSRTAVIPFIFLSAMDDPSEQLKGLRMGADEYLTKPLDAKNIIETMGRALEKAGRLKNSESEVDFSGNLDQVGLNEIVQVLEINEKTGELTLSDKPGKPIGIIFFKNGNMFHASSGTLTGNEAFYELASLKSGMFRFIIKTPDLIENLSGQNMSLLFEAARLTDEAETLTELISGPSARFRIVSADIPNSIRNRTDSNHLERITGLIKNSAKLREIIAKSGISRPHTEAVIAELIKAEVIEEDEPVITKTEEKKAKFPMLVKGNLVKQLQKIEQSSFTGKIDIQGRSKPAAIFIQNGRVVNACHGDTVGEKALFRIFSERGGVCKIIHSPVEVEDKIFDPLDALFEGASREIAWRRQMKKDFSSVRVVLNGNHEINNNGQTADPEAQKILSLVKSQENMQTIIDQSPFTDVKTATLLNGLKKKGAVAFQVSKAP
ncbi:MAG: response regulator [Deltaproteobacteria bacterium]|nr:response regulator [Deltaproteobacteria bacterium]